LTLPVIRIVLLPLPKAVDELPGTKKDRECLRGLDFYVQGTPLNAADILSIRYKHVKLALPERPTIQHDACGYSLIQ
jgi:hypothetical protein